MRSVSQRKGDEEPCVSLRACDTDIRICFCLLTQRSRVRFSGLSDFLSSNGSGTGSTQLL
jgi:hypothetical protein